MRTVFNSFNCCLYSVVDDDERSFAIAINSFLYYLLG